MPSPSAVERADQSVATRFTRLMNASTSRWGVLTDPPIVALASAVGLLALLAAVISGAGPAVARPLGAVAATPLAVALVMTVALRGARGRVVAWLARQPFPVENMNGVLNGLGDALEVTFTGEVPPQAELNAELDKVHPDAFVTGGIEDARMVDIRIGVIDSMRNPAASNHRRYARVLELVERALAPLSERYPIESVRVK